LERFFRLKPRHAAALALLGAWWIITAPVKNGIVDVAAPLTTWDLGTATSVKSICVEEVLRQHRCAAILRGGPGDAIDDCDFPDEKGRKDWKLNPEMQRWADQDASAKCVWLK
jgi:hypothetical protein